MTEELSDYSKFAEGPLRFPINGKVYELPPIGIEDGLTLAGVLSGRDKAFQRKDGAELFKLVLGPLWDEMAADGVPLEAATRAGLAALADRNYGREFAKIAWETGADPKALEPYLRQRAAQGNRASRRSNSTGGAKKTQKPASTRGTTSRGK